MANFFLADGVYADVVTSPLRWSEMMSIAIAQLEESLPKSQQSMRPLYLRVHTESGVDHKYCLTMEKASACITKYNTITMRYGSEDYEGAVR